MDQMNNQIQKRYWLLMIIGVFIMIVGIVLMLIFPIILTQFTSNYDFNKTAPIGDTIGGITAPIAAIIGSLLVFISFLEQWKSNKIQTNNILNDRKFEILEKRVRELSLLFKENYTTGKDKFQSYLKLNQPTQFDSFFIDNFGTLLKSYNCLKQFLFISDQINYSEELSAEQIEYLNDQILLVILDNIYVESFFDFKNDLNNKYDILKIINNSNRQFYLDYREVVNKSLAVTYKYTKKHFNMQ
jgi:hypothetical protein